MKMQNKLQHCAFADRKFLLGLAIFLALVGLSSQFSRADSDDDDDSGERVIRKPTGKVPAPGPPVKKGASTSSRQDKAIFGEGPQNKVPADPAPRAPPARPDTCLLPPVGGLCRAYFESYYYDPARDSCEKFVYGGCGGNANRFGNRDDCVKACNPGRNDEVGGARPQPPPLPAASDKEALFLKLAGLGTKGKGQTPSALPAGVVRRR